MNQTQSLNNSLPTPQYPNMANHVMVVSGLVTLVSLVALAILFSTTTPFGSLNHLILFTIPGALTLVGFTVFVISFFLRPQKEEVTEKVNEEVVDKKEKPIERTISTNDPSTIVVTPVPIESSQSTMENNIASKIGHRPPDNETSNVLNIKPTEEIIEVTPIVKPKNFEELMTVHFKPILDQMGSFLKSFLHSHATASGKKVDPKKLTAVDTLFNNLWTFLKKLMNNESFVLKNMIFSLAHVPSKSNLFRRWNYALSFGDENAKKDILARKKSRDDLLQFLRPLKTQKYDKTQWVTFTKNYLEFLEKQIALYPADDHIDDCKRRLLKLLSNNITEASLFKDEVDKVWNEKISKISDIMEGLDSLDENDKHKDKELDRELFNFLDEVYNRIQATSTVSGELKRLFDKLMTYMIEKSEDSATLTEFMTKQIGFLKREVNVNIRSLMDYFNKSVLQKDQTDAVHRWNLLWENLTPENNLEDNETYKEMLNLQLNINQKIDDNDKKIAIVALTQEEASDATLLELAYPNLAKEKRQQQFISQQKILKDHTKDIQKIESQLQGGKKIYAILCPEGIFPMITMKKMENYDAATIWERVKQTPHKMKLGLIDAALGVATKLLGVIRKFVYIPLDLAGLDKAGNEEFYKILVQAIDIVAQPGYDLMLSKDNPIKKKFFDALNTYAPIINGAMDEIISKKPIQTEVIRDKMVEVIKKIEKTLTS